MARSRKPRTLAPTDALDLAYGALAQNDPEDCLRRAIPALDDEGAGAPALDAVARAAVALGSMHLARTAFTAAAKALALQGLGSHAMAAAVSVRRLSGTDTALETVARSLAADVSRVVETSVLPPPLTSVPVGSLDASMSREALLAQAQRAVDAALLALPDELPARRAHALWSALTTQELVRFGRVLNVRLVPAGDTVIREGEHGGSVYVVARGEVRVARQSPTLRIVDDGSETEGRPSSAAGPIPLPEDHEELAVLGAESVLGEMALLTAAPRAASAQATRATLLVELDPDALAAAVADAPALGEALAAWGRRRLVINLLRTASLLKSVPASEREPLAQAFEPRRYEPGEVLFSQGSDPQGLYLLASGRVDVLRHEGEAETLIASVGPGGCVGEISLLLRRPTSATVVATEPTVALLLGAEHFMQVVRKHPALLASLYDLAVHRAEELISVLDADSEAADDLVLL